TEKAAAIVEVCGVHHECAAFPVPNGIAEPEPHTWRKVRLAVQTNDSRIVNHFDVDHHFVASLDDLIITVVDIRNHRRHSSGKDDALVLKTKVIRASRMTEQLQAAALFGGSGWQKVGNLSVGRIGDD